MEFTPLAEGVDINELPGYEKYYEEGQYGVLLLSVASPLSEEALALMESEIVNHEVRLVDHIRQDGGVVVIRFQKAIAPLLIIAAVVGGIVAITGGLLGWQVWRANTAGIPWWLVLVGGAALLYLLFHKPAEAAARGAGRIAESAASTYIVGKAARAVALPIKNPRRRKSRRSNPGAATVLEWALIIGALGTGGYFGWKWWQGRSGKFSLSLSSTPTGAGEINREPYKDLYSLGDTVQITAVASGGHVFNYWQMESGASNTTNPLTLTIAKNVALVAHFS